MSRVGDKYLKWLKERDVYHPLNDSKSNQFSDAFLEENDNLEKEVNNLYGRLQEDHNEIDKLRKALGQIAAKSDSRYLIKIAKEALYG